MTDFALQGKYDTLHAKHVGYTHINPKAMEYMLKAHKRDNGGSKLIDVKKYQFY